MKKGNMHFLGRKKQSLFDTNSPVKIQTMENGLSENMGLMLDSSAIPDTGTAKVRSRPTVKHHISSSEGIYGVAVPTPTVPIFSTFNGVKGDGTEGDRLSNGSVISLSDPVEGDIFVPPPPSVAPPPPPTQFITLPPPDFMGELDSPTRAMIQRPTMPPPKPPSEPPALQDLTSLRPPPMTPPKPPSEPPALQDLSSLRPPPMTPPKPPSELPASEDFTSLRPPPMTPQKPLSTYSIASTPISTPPPSMVPELPDCPKFAPPKPPSEKPKKPGKTPPPKPTRLSSIAGTEDFIQPNPPAASHQMNTPSSFNPQNNAKLYNAPKTSVLNGQGDFDPRPKQILLLQASSTETSEVDGKTSPTPPSKPIRGTAPAETQLDKEPTMNPQANITAKTAQLQPKPEAKTVISSLQEKDLVPSLPPVSPKFSKEPSTPDLLKVARGESPIQKGNFSPLINRKLRNLKGPETSHGSSTSPFALLQAAKEREKHRSPKTSFKHRHSSPNSFVVTPRSNSISSATPENGLEEDSRSTYSAVGPMSTEQTQPLHLDPPSVRSPAAPRTPALSGTSAGISPSFSRLASEKQEVKQATPSLDYRKSEANPPETPMALLPPPPEFSNFNFSDIMDLPPDFPPPDPPTKKAPLPMIKPVYAAPAPPPKPTALAPTQAPSPAPPPKPKPVAPVPSPAPVQDVKPIVYQTLPRLPVQKPLPDVSESQATLLSILQKKMKEMDSKINLKREMESSNDEWGSSTSEDTKIPFIPRTTPQNNKNYMLPMKNANLDMRELETKVAKKQQDNASASSKETQSKQHGMTFTVRPGTKQPITLVSKGEPAQAL